MSFRKPLSVDVHFDDEVQSVHIYYYNFAVTRTFADGENLVSINAHRSYSSLNFQSNEVIEFKLPVFHADRTGINLNGYVGEILDCKLMSTFLDVQMITTIKGEKAIDMVDHEIFERYINMNEFIKAFAKMSRKIQKENPKATLKECFDTYYQSTKFELLTKK
jgi:hypothetical protein